MGNGNDKFSISHGVYESFSSGGILRRYLELNRVISFRRAGNVRHGRIAIYYSGGTGVKKKADVHRPATLKMLARRMDDGFQSFDTRLSRVERELTAMKRDMRGLRRTSRDLFSYVELIDREFRIHRHDKAIHSGMMMATAR